MSFFLKQFSLHKGYTASTNVSVYKEKLKDKDKNFKQVAKKQNVCLYWS